MIPHSFDYHAPETMDGVFKLLDKYGEASKLMAGGQSLLPMMKFRLVSPGHIIDLSRLRGFDGISEAGNEIRIGALATHRSIGESRVIQNSCPLLAKAAACLGDVQVRNIGTIGGSVAHADPAANYSPVLVALAAKFILRSKGGERIVAAVDFFKSMFVTDLRPTEVLTEICIPVLPANTGWEYVKLSRRASDFALISVAVLLRGDEKGLCIEAHVVLGSVAPVPVRMQGVEQVLRGKPLNQASLEAAARATTLGPDTQSDVHADAAYRIEVAPVCVRRALEVAVTRMTGRK